MFPLVFLCPAQDLSLWPLPSPLASLNPFLCPLFLQPNWSQSPFLCLFSTQLRQVYIFRKYSLWKDYIIQKGNIRKMRTINCVNLQHKDFWICETQWKRWRTRHRTFWAHDNNSLAISWLSSIAIPVQSLPSQPWSPLDECHHDTLDQSSASLFYQILFS